MFWPVAQVRPAEGESITGTGGVFPDVMVQPRVGLLPWPSLTLTRGSQVPAGYERLVVGPVASSYPPSPSRSQVMVSGSPSASSESDASNWTMSGAGPLVGLAVASTIGGWLTPLCVMRWMLLPCRST